MCILKRSSQIFGYCDLVNIEFPPPPHKPTTACASPCPTAFNIRIRWWELATGYHIYQYQCNVRCWLNECANIWHRKVKGKGGHPNAGFVFHSHLHNVQINGRPTLVWWWALRVETSSEECSYRIVAMPLVWSSCMFHIHHHREGLLVGRIIQPDLTQTPFVCQRYYGGTVWLGSVVTFWVLLCKQKSNMHRPLLQFKYMAHL